MRYLALGLVILTLGFLTLGCDSTSNEPPCALVADETYTFSTPLVARVTEQPIILFEFQQEIRTYEAGGCARTQEDVNEVSVVVRNLTACVVSVTYSASLVSEGEGFTYEGNATMQPNAAQDRGVIIRDSPILISNAQAVVTGTSTLTECP
jgi:hypothetical protein